MHMIGMRKLYIQSRAFSLQSRHSHYSIFNYTRPERVEYALNIQPVRQCCRAFPPPAPSHYEVLIATICTHAYPCVRHPVRRESTAIHQPRHCDRVRVSIMSAGSLTLLQHHRDVYTWGPVYLLYSMFRPVRIRNVFER